MSDSNFLDKSHPQLVATSDEPPTTLGERGMQMWNDILSEYDLGTVAERELLVLICESADRLAEIEETIRRDGIIIETRRGKRPHPLLKVQLELRGYLTRSLHRLLPRPRRPRRPSW